MLETECHRWMADALPKQGGNLGAPDMKSVSVGAWKCWVPEARVWTVRRPKTGGCSARLV